MWVETYSEMFVRLRSLQGPHSATVWPVREELNFLWPVTEAVRSKERDTSDRSNTGIVSSNPTGGMNIYICISFVLVLSCVGSGLATGWSPVQGDLQTVYKIHSFHINSEKGTDHRVWSDTGRSCYELATMLLREYARVKSAFVSLLFRLNNSSLNCIRVYLLWNWGACNQFGQCIHVFYFPLTSTGHCILRTI
jgi:hypothetical protein